MLAIVGESGAGKSTLLHILSALDQASAGDVYCAQLKLNSLSADEAAEFRNREAGFVWQFHYLLPEFTAAENVAMPLLMRGIKLGRGGAGSIALAARGRVGAARPIIAPGSFPAESSSGWPWHGRSSPGRSCCWRMSLPETWIGSTAEAVFELIARLHREHQLTSIDCDAQFVVCTALPSRAAAGAGTRGRDQRRSRCRH